MWRRLVALAAPWCCGGLRLPDTPYWPGTKYEVFSIDCAAQVTFTGVCSCGTSLAGVRISIDDCEPGDTLDPPPSAGGLGVTSAWEVEPSCTLALRGAITVGDYLRLISEVRFSTSEVNKADKMVRYSLGEETYSPATGHLYKVFPIARAVPDGSWYNAQCFCADPSNDLLGLVGYLLTVTSDLEKEWAAKYTDGQGWLGGSDLGAEGSWRWVVGPEGCPGYNTDPAANPCTRSACDIGPQSGKGGCNGGTQCDQGTLFWQGNAGGAAQGGMLTAWAGGEPNNSGRKEHFLHNLVNNAWNDYPLTNGNIQSFECEWGDVGDICIDQAYLRQERMFTYGLDECEGNTACPAGQTCEDESENPVDLGDWNCTCTTPLVGTQQAAAATCKCPDGQIGQPPTVPCEECTVNAHCNGNAAASVPNAMATACECTCLPGFAEPTCDRCKSGIVGALCDTCAVRYVGTAPGCTECTNVDNCNNNARAGGVSSTDDRTACTCTCKEGFAGGDCGVCVAGRALPLCEACAAGYVGLPNCRACTDADCNGKAKAGGVSSNAARTACTCDCVDGYAGDDCSVCAAGWKGNPAGGVPCSQCSRADCSNHGDASSTEGSAACTCMCDMGFTGAGCSQCATGYAAPNCAVCAAGYKGDPANSVPCTACTRADCSNHGEASSAEGAAACRCSCEAGFAQSDCSACEVGYAAPFCRVCAAGFKGNPLAGAACTACSRADCSGHGEASSPAGAQSCSCACDAPGLGGASCDTCVAGHIGYPVCTKCDVDVHCGGKAVSVAADQTTDECVCSCEEGFDPGTACSSCSPGYVPPLCAPCSNDGYCNGRARFVKLQGNTCLCDCLPEFTGPTCAACSAGFVGEQCTPCDIDTHCRGNAVSISVDPAQEKCVCECKEGFVGETCVPEPIDECAMGCASCENGECDDVGQVCEDPDHAGDSLGDWTCRCKPGIDGAPRIGGPTTCWAYALGGAARASLRGGSGDVADASGPLLPLGLLTTAGAAADLALIRNMRCGKGGESAPLGVPLDFEYSPLRAGFGPEQVQYVVGAAVMNVSLVLLVVIALRAASALAQPVFQMDSLSARGWASSPGAAYLPFLYVLQGTTYAAGQLAFYMHEGAGFHLLGVAVLVVVVASPVVMYRRLLRRLPETAEALADPRLQAPGDEDPAFPDLRVIEGLPRSVYELCFGTEIVVSVSREHWVAEHHGVVFDRLRVDKAWVVAVEMTKAVALGLLATWAPQSVTLCDVRNFTVLAILVGHFVLLLYHRPYIAVATNVLNITVSAAVSASMAAVVIGMALRHEPDDGSMKAGAALLWVSTSLVQAKIAWDLITRGYDVTTGRQRDVRRVWRQVRPDEEALVQDGPAMHGAPEATYTTLLPLSPEATLLAATMTDTISPLPLLQSTQRGLCPQHSTQLLHSTAVNPRKATFGGALPAPTTAYHPPSQALHVSCISAATSQSPPSAVAHPLSPAVVDL